MWYWELNSLFSNVESVTNILLKNNWIMHAKIFIPLDTVMSLLDFF